MSEFYWLNPFSDSRGSEPILRDVFSWVDNGIFAAMENLAEEALLELPWGDDAETLDMTYFGNHSGAKFCSPLVKLILQTEGMVDEYGRINSTGTAKLASVLIRKYLTNWRALWATTDATYNPIHNYDMVEVRSTQGVESNSTVGESELAKTGTDTLAHGLAQTTQHGRGNEEMNYRYGINTDAEDPKPSEKMTSQDSGTTVTTDSGSDVTTKNLLDSTTEEESSVSANVEQEEIHRSGNIGVTTTQQMLTAERELWKWNFFEQVFRDIDRELALQFHDPCRV